MAFGTERVIQAVNGLQSALATALEQGFASLRITTETTLEAAQRARDSAADAHSRADAIHSELQGLRADLGRLHTSLDASRAAAETHTDERVLRQIADLHATIEGLRADTAEARTAAETHQPAAETTDSEQRTPETPATPGTEEFDDLLALAAGIAYAEISCHRDTWDFLVAQAAHGEHFRLPGDVGENTDGLVSADISGRTLIAILDALWRTRLAADTAAGTRHLAATVYDRIGAALRNVETGTPPEEQPESSPPKVTRIVIDDRPPAASS